MTDSPEFKIARHPFSVAGSSARPVRVLQHPGPQSARGVSRRRRAPAALLGENDV